MPIEGRKQTHDRIYFIDVEIGDADSVPNQPSQDRYSNRQYENGNREVRDANVRLASRRKNRSMSR